MGEPIPTISSLPVSLALYVDQVCRRFEGDWQEGRTPQIELFLDESLQETKVLLWELLILDLAYRRKWGEQPHVEEYQRRFPDHVELITALQREGHFSALPSEPVPGME